MVCDAGRLSTLFLIGKVYIQADLILYFVLKGSFNVKILCKDMTAMSKLCKPKPFLK